MRWTKEFTIICVVVLLIPGSCTDDESKGFESATHNSLLLISIDGFVFDYLDAASTPTMDSLISQGVRAQSLVPVFPSKTFPNHYTQVTGWYPENHGIISNRMYDPELNEYFSLSDPSARDGKWYAGEPIWATAQKQGLTSATMFWPGADAEIGGIRPDFYFTFNGATSDEARIQQVLDWMSWGKSRPDFMSLYFERIDQVGHNFGPHAEEVSKEVELIDGLLSELLDGITRLGLEDRVNVIIVSDHGMAKLSRDRVIFLDDYLDLNQVEVINWSPILELIPKPGLEEQVFDNLKNAHPQWQVYQKGSLPSVLHFDDHQRMTPIIAVAEAGWSISSTSFFGSNPEAFQGGAHGYSPEVAAMCGIFLASGPAFQRGVNTGPVESIHLYELMCNVLDLVPAENDGDLKVWEQMLSD